MKLFDFGFVILNLPDLVGEHARQAIDCLPCPCRHLRRVDLVLGCNFLRRLVSAKRLKRYRGLKLILKTSSFLYPVFKLGYMCGCPVLRKEFLNTSEGMIGCSHVFGLRLQPYICCGPLWTYAGQVQIILTGFLRRVSNWFS